MLPREQRGTQPINTPCLWDQLLFLRRSAITSLGVASSPTLSFAGGPSYRWFVSRTRRLWLGAWLTSKKVQLLLTY